MTLTTKEAVLADLRDSLSKRRVSHVVPGSEEDDKCRSQIFPDAMVFYFDVGDPRLFDDVQNFDGFWIREDPTTVYDDLTLLRLFSDHAAGTFFDYFFSTAESHYNEPHQYKDAILNKLSAFYDRLRAKYATPELYLHRLVALGLINDDWDLAFAWDPVEAASRIDRLRRYNRKMNPYQRVEFACGRGNPDTVGPMIFHNDPVE